MRQVLKFDIVIIVEKFVIAHIIIAIEVFLNFH